MSTLHPPSLNVQLADAIARVQVTKRDLEHATANVRTRLEVHHRACRRLEQLRDLALQPTRHASEGVSIMSQMSRGGGDD